MKEKTSQNDVKNKAPRVLTASGDQERDTSAQPWSLGGFDAEKVLDGLPANSATTGQRQSAMLQLQVQYGNNAVQRLIIQRDDDQQNMSTDPSSESATDQSEATGPEIEEVNTPYGTFAVYPDNFVGPLEVADPTGAAGGWPVRRSTFDQIETAMESISGGGADIEIQGTATFKSAVLMDFAWLMTQSVGYELIESIVGTGKKMTIVSTNGGNRATGTGGAWLNEDSTPGPGSDATVHYNTGEWNPYGGDEEWMTRPPAIGLAHEMIHAFTYMSGTTARGETDGTDTRELQATGLGAYEEAVYTENRFRVAFGLSERPRY